MATPKEQPRKGSKKWRDEHVRMPWPPEYSTVQVPSLRGPLSDPRRTQPAPTGNAR